MASTPTWLGAKAGQDANISYSINAPDAATGAVTIVATAPVGTTQYIVSATGTGNYNESTTGTIAIKTTAALAGTLAYNTARVTTTTTLQNKPIWTGVPSGVSLSYTAISTTHGSSTVATPTWANVIESTQSVVYSITPIADGISIDSGTGTISVANTANVAASGSYTVIATGANTYGGSITATIAISIATKALQGSLKANPIRIIEGATTTSSPTWSNAPAGQLHVGNISYSLSPEVEGISVDSATCTITVTSQRATLIKTTLVATGQTNYSGVQEASVTIEVQGTISGGSMQYEDLPIANTGTVISPAPTWLNLSIGAQRSLKYNEKLTNANGTEATGLVANTATGAITVQGDTTAGTYTITATGTGVFTGTVYGTITISQATSNIDGSLGYTLASDATKLVTLLETTYGTKLTANTKWSGRTSETQAVSYSISPTISGISINSSTGVISIATTAQSQLASAYTITASGTGNFAGLIQTTILIGIKGTDLTGEVTYADVTTVYGTATQSAAPTGIEDKTVKYSLLLPPAGVSIDERTGIVYIADTTAVRTKDSVTIVAIGTGNYEGSIQGTISVEATAKLLEGSISYDSITHTYGTTTTYEPVISNPLGQTGIYSISPVATSISIDSSTGTITENKDAQTTLEAVLYTISAVGTGNNYTKEAKVATITIHADYDICLQDNTLPDAVNGIIPISNWRQLANITTNPGGSYTLTDDIEMPNKGQCSDYTESGWTPIPSFLGTLDGDGKAIKNLYIWQPDAVGSALINQTTGTVEIKNLLIEHVGILGRSYASALIATGTGDSLSITNVRVTSPNNSTIKAQHPASIAAYALATTNTISASSDNTTIEPNPSETPGSIGDLVGVSYRSLTITGYFSGSIVTPYEYLGNVGGLIGYLCIGEAYTLNLRGYYVNNDEVGTTLINGLIGDMCTPMAGKIDIEGIARGSTTYRGQDNVVSKSSVNASAIIHVYNSVNETYLTNAAFTTSKATDIAYKEDMAKSSFSNLTFGSAAGEWSWDDNTTATTSTFPKINIVASTDTQIEGAKQPTECIGNRNVELDVLVQICAPNENMPLLENSVYQISNWKQLTWIDNCAKGNYVLTNDIYLPTPGSDPLYGVQGWTPLFLNDIVGFLGTLDGKGYAIRNFYANNTYDLFGLISVMGRANTVLKNLKIVHTGVTFKSGGVFVGISLYSTSHPNSEITNIGLEATNDEIVTALYSGPSARTDNISSGNGALVGVYRKSPTTLRGYSTTKTNENITGLVGYQQGGNTAPIGTIVGYMMHADITEPANVSTDSFVQTDGTGKADFLANTANAKFRDDLVATDLHTDWVWPTGTDGNELTGVWPAVQLLGANDRDTTAADYVAPLGRLENNQ